MDFKSCFENHPSGDEDLRGIGPNNCNVKRSNAFLKGNSAPLNFEYLVISVACVTIPQNNGSRQSNIDEVGREIPLEWPHGDN